MKEGRKEHYVFDNTTMYNIAHGVMRVLVKRKRNGLKMGIAMTTCMTAREVEDRQKGRKTVKSSKCNVGSQRLCEGL